LVLVVVVLVVTGPGTVVCSEVVVVLVVGVAAHADNDTRAAAARHGTMIFFINMAVVSVFALQPTVTSRVDPVLWGIGPVSK